MDLQWSVFPGIGETSFNAADLKTVPSELASVPRRDALFQNNVFTDEKAGNESMEALFLSAFDLEEDKVLSFGIGAWYYYKLFLNGELLLDNMAYGNKPYSRMSWENFIVPGRCRKGGNILAVVLKTPPQEIMSLAFKVLEDYPWQETRPVIENFRAVLQREKYPQEGSASRKNLCQLVQNGVRMMRNTVFNPFASGSSLDAEKAAALEKEFPILYFYDKALDRIKEDVAGSAPEENEVWLWHLYNMGYVVKSSKTCFGLDLCHRRAAELEPFLDFLLTTHNHRDHFSEALFKEMGENGKSVVSNFYPLPGFHRPPAELEFEGVKIAMEENDHNPILRKFVSSYYLTLHNGCRIFATGDSRDVTQLDPPERVDLFIPHPRVGLKVPEAVEKFHPACVLYSHLLEMGHCPPSPWYAVPFDLLDEERSQVESAGTATCAPVWGERLIWHTGMRRFI